MRHSKPSDGIGDRLAKYRRIAGFSAQELSDRIGGELSRGVIANIESGRKTDITVDQLLILAWALGIPPAALALPLEKPFSWVPMARGKGQWSWLRVIEALNWMTETPDPFRKDRSLSTTEAGVVARNRLRVLKEMAVVSNDVRRAQALADDDPEAFSDLVAERRLEYEAVMENVKELGIDPTVYSLKAPSEDYGIDLVDAVRIDNENWHVNHNISDETVVEAMERMMPYG